jgi:hypothetical protein
MKYGSVLRRDSWFVRSRETLPSRKNRGNRAKTTSRVVYYQVDTPITQEEPYYEVSVRVKDTIYVGDYAPRHAGATLPEEWRLPEAEVRLRLEKHYMFLTRPTGTELQFVITKCIAAAPLQESRSPSQEK